MLLPGLLINHLPYARLFDRLRVGRRSIERLVEEGSLTKADTNGTDCITEESVNEFLGQYQNCKFYLVAEAQEQLNITRDTMLKLMKHDPEHIIYIPWGFDGARIPRIPQNTIKRWRNLLKAERKTRELKRKAKVSCTTFSEVKKKLRIGDILLSKLVDQGSLEQIKDYDLITNRSLKKFLGRFFEDKIYKAKEVRQILGISWDAYDKLRKRHSDMLIHLPSAKYSNVIPESAIDLFREALKPPELESGMENNYTPEELRLFEQRDLGGMIRHLRLRAGYTEVPQLAKETGISQERLYMVEYRNGCMNLQDLEKLSIVLNRPGWYLPFIRKQLKKIQTDNRCKVPEFFSTNEMHRLEVESLKNAQVPDFTKNRADQELANFVFWEVRDILGNWEEHGFSKKMVQAFYLIHYKDGRLREKKLGCRAAVEEAKNLDWWKGPYSHEGILIQYKKAVKHLRYILTKEGYNQ